MVWSVKVKDVPSVGGLLPNVRGLWLDAKTWLLLAAIQSAVPTWGHCAEGLVVPWPACHWPGDDFSLMSWKHITWGALYF